jgi:hypothetical protein
MTNQETEIKKMARDICLLPCACDHCQIQRTNKGKCQARTYAERAYAKGWRKETDHEKSRMA